MTSLKDAANSYGCEASKGYLPHRYLQNVQSRAEILRRINEPVSWRELEPYMDWFGDTGDKELHTRVSGRSTQQWIETTQIYKDWSTKKDTMCDFKTDMLDYLKKDVECLYQLVEKSGHKYDTDYGIAIRHNFTTE